MGRKSRSKNYYYHHREPIAEAPSQTAECGQSSKAEEDTTSQIVSMCREYVANFQPLTELKDENRKLKRPLIPSGFTTLMDRYVKPTIYSETMENIRQTIAGQKLFISFSYSCNGHCYCCVSTDHIEVINVAIGVLKAKQRGEVFIINTVLSGVPSISEDCHNLDFFTTLFTDSLNLLWPNNVSSHLEDVLILLTELEMAKAGFELSIIYPHMIHVTCLDKIIMHCEEILCHNYKKARRLVELVSMYIESYTCGDPPYGTLEQFQAEASLPQPLPMKLTIANFLELSVYIFENIDLFNTYFFQHQDITSAMLIKAVSDVKTQRELAMLKVKYSPLLVAKRIIRSHQVPSILQSISAFEEFRTKLEKWPDEQSLFQKMNSLFTRNGGYQALLQYFHVLSVDNTEQQRSLVHQLRVDCSLEQVQLFLYAPLTTRDRFHFPQFTLLKKLSQRVPANCLGMYSAIYTYLEETNKDEQLFEHLKQRAIYHESVNIAFFDTY